MIPAGEYVHKKTGNLYTVIQLVLNDSFIPVELVNSTNAQSGRHMVVYRRSEAPKCFFVREEDEFLERFSKVTASEA